MTLSELKELIELVSEKGFAEFEVERSGFKLRIVASHPPLPSRPEVVLSSPAVVAAQDELPFPRPALAALPAVPEAPPSPRPADDGLNVVRSPIVGTFYRAPGPASDPFVKIGDRIEVGTVLCIVEAMKLMNEIESEFAGEIVKVYVENSQPVEYGQPLFGIRP
jgi:acetyl-CoA carboxylase biotin carboxyl carrier protein